MSFSRVVKISPFSNPLLSTFSFRLVKPFPLYKHVSLFHQGNLLLSKKKITDPWYSKTALSLDIMKQILISEKIQLIDVRTNEEVSKSGMIAGAINIPLKELKNALELDSDAFYKIYRIRKPRQADLNIVFYGLKDVSGLAACEIAHNVGFKKSKYFEGGWSSWKKSKK